MAAWFDEMSLLCGEEEEGRKTVKGVGGLFRRLHFGGKGSEHSENTVQEPVGGLVFKAGAARCR